MNLSSRWSLTNYHRYTSANNTAERSTLNKRRVLLLWWWMRYYSHYLPEGLKRLVKLYRSTSPLFIFFLYPLSPSLSRILSFLFSACTILAVFMANSAYRLSNWLNRISDLKGEMLGTIDQRARSRASPSYHLGRSIHRASPFWKSYFMGID